MNQDNCTCTKFWGSLPEVLTQVANYVIQRPEKSMGIWNVDFSTVAGQTSGEWVAFVYEYPAIESLNATNPQSYSSLDKLESK